MSPSERAGRAFLSGVVLAAGSSARMGRAKLILPLAGRPLLQRAIDAVAGSRLDDFVLVLGADATADELRSAIALPRAARIAVQTEPARGLAASLAAGLRAADPHASAAAVLLGDQPGVDAALVDRVATAFLAGGRLAARPVFRDARGRRVPGHPVFLARELWPHALALRGDEGARALFAAHPDWLFEVELDAEPPLDVDTPEDYARALATVEPARSEREEP